MAIDELIPKNTVRVQDSNDYSGNHSMNRRGFLGYMSKTMITAGLSLMLLLYGAGCQESQKQAQLNQPVQPEAAVVDSQDSQRTFQKGDYGLAESVVAYNNAANAAELGGRVATDIGRASYKVPFLRAILPDKPAN